MRNPVFALGLALIAILTSPSSAPASIALDVSPAKLEMSAAPGLSENIPVTVHNASSAPVHVQVTMSDFTVTSSGSYVFQKVGAQRYSLLQWASINPREFDMPPNTSQQIRLTIATPKSVAVGKPDLAGEYAGIVLFTTRAERHLGAVGFSARVTTKIYDALSATKLAGEITHFNAMQTVQGEVYDATFRNTGTQHTYLSGSLHVLRNGATVDTIDLPAQQLVERDGTRQIEVTGKRLAPGSYTAIAAIDYGGKAMTGAKLNFDVR